jgi:hypothetical protein
MVSVRLPYLHEAYFVRHRIFFDPDNVLLTIRSVEHGRRGTLDSFRRSDVLYFALVHR